MHNILTKKTNPNIKEQLRYKFTEIGEVAHFLERLTNVSWYQFPVSQFPVQSLYKTNILNYFSSNISLF